ncbi:hypothetical protein [Pseudopedobacter sp.]|uniref:hypothetical protein n=1 Tax=Pseudopedobacter sp. TaxID=1936787 RepID=UPI00333E3874
MNRLQSYVLNRFALLNKAIDANQLADIIKGNNSDFELGFRVLKVNIISDVQLAVELLKRLPTYLLDFDSDNSEMIRRESFLFTKSIFEINLNQQYLMTFGSLSQNNDAKVFLKRIGLNYKLDQLYIDIASFYESSNCTYEDVFLKAVAIKKFNYRNGMVGRFSGEIVDNSIAAELIGNYSKDLLKATFAIKTDGCRFDLQIFPNGAFKILTNDCEQRDILEKIIPNLLK